jgi:hypothetical protein
LDNSTDFQSSCQKLSKESRQELCRRHADLYSAARILPHQPMFEIVSWKSRVIGFGHAELDIGDADRAEYR